MESHEGEGLSDLASRLLAELCADARKAGVLPERLIAMVKREIASIPFPGDDPARRRARLARAVTKCIRAYHGVSGEDVAPA